MKRILVGVAASFVLAGAGARAQTSAVVFTTVDAVRVEPDRLLITGVKVDETAETVQPIVCAVPSVNTPQWAATTYCPALLQSCERLATVAMANPGHYRFEVEPHRSGDRCTLRRAAR